MSSRVIGSRSGRNSARWVAAALGVLTNGAWLVPINTRFKGGEASHVLGKTNAKVLMCVNRYLGTDSVELIRGANPELRALDNVVIMDGPVPEGTLAWQEFLGLADKTPEQDIRNRIDAIQPDDVSDIIFTSRTTGQPKGVILRHGASLETYQLCNGGWQIGEGDRALIVMPFFHCFGYKFGWMLSLMSGAVSVSMAVFEPEGAFRAIEEHGITHIGGSPTMFWAMLDHPARLTADLSSLRVAMVASTSRLSWFTGCETSWGSTMPSPVTA